MTSLLTEEMFTYAPRFFPVFVGVAKFVRMRILGTKLDGRVALLKEQFTMAGRKLQCRAHAAALSMVVEGGKVALDLAAVEKDSEETDRIVAGLGLNLGEYPFLATSAE
jgi:hypothetical protein